MIATRFSQKIDREHFFHRLGSILFCSGYTYVLVAAVESLHEQKSLMLTACFIFSSRFYVKQVMVTYTNIAQLTILGK